MAVWEDIQLLIQAIADLREDVAAYSLRTPGPPIEIYRNVEIEPGGAWGENLPFQIYLEGIGSYLENNMVDEITDIKSKLNELITAYNQLRIDYNSSTWPSSAPYVNPLP